MSELIPDFDTLSKVECWLSCTSFELSFDDAVLRMLFLLLFFSYDDRLLEGHISNDLVIHSMYLSKPFISYDLRTYESTISHLLGLIGTLIHGDFHDGVFHDNDASIDK